MLEGMIVQKFKIPVDSSFSLAEKYYGMLSVVHDLKLTTREIQLLSFTSIKGSISYSHIREEFCSLYDTSSPTVNNMISKLKKKRVLIKSDGKIKVHPTVSLDFNKDIRIETEFAHGK